MKSLNNIMKNSISENTIVEKNNGKVSIIIPAYNAGKFLTVMLDSIAEQTYSNIEVIVAYDIKSTDNTLEILRSYKGIRKLVIDEAKDSSSGQARNRGFRLATGEYIIFLDADDKIIPTYIADLIEVFMRYPYLDVVCGNRISSTESEVPDKYNLAIQSESNIETYSQETALRHLLYRDTLAGEPWAWLVKKEYLVKNNINFPNYSHGDDTVWVFQLILNTNQIGRCSKIGYIFIQHPTSITNSISSPVDSWNKYSKYREDVYSLVNCVHPDIANDFLSLDTRYFVRKLTKQPYLDFQRALTEYNIYKLLSVKEDGYLSKLSIYCFNISKYTYWRILQLRIFQDRI